MGKAYEEWLHQADYDMDTAEFMLAGGRCFYAVFMCHLAVEKAIKGLFQRKLDRVPPKVHHLTQLLSATGCEAPPEIAKFLVRLNEANVATRHPEDIRTLTSVYDETVAGTMIDQGKEAIRWIKSQF